MTPSRGNYTLNVLVSDTVTLIFRGKYTVEYARISLPAMTFARIQEFLDDAF